MERPCKMQTLSNRLRGQATACGVGRADTAAKCVGRGHKQSAPQNSENNPGRQTPDLTLRWTSRQPRRWRRPALQVRETIKYIVYWLVARRRTDKKTTNQQASWEVQSCVAPTCLDSGTVTLSRPTTRPHPCPPTSPPSPTPLPGSTPTVHCWSAGLLDHCCWFVTHHDDDRVGPGCGT